MSRRGFTLVEVVVALGVTALVMAALAGTVTASLHARAAATETLDRTTTARTALLHLERELAAALPEGFSVSATPPTLRFTGGAEPGAHLTYFVQDGALARRAEPRFAAPDAPLAPVVALAPGVSALDVRVLDGTEWKSVWTGREPPRAARVALTLDDGQELDVVVPIPTGRGRRES
ncbi:MAG TPA: type II secretion system protein [Candidatus Eisenbacteria bacterium]|nr:type II secretion system protein [Candidatus Eisenbacteria bacterium]